ncbi:amidophosphoribosyltransferase [candidate division WOR-1 bacterium RIFOXYB2_FULL_42_35]|uniref:Amidophosphoribosyltransferase n=1 Tax=candidate division WOR-1 bacterium RIFOXYC2_FULL_41_25 TaxID=1802586 RepID=A0A1F4TPW4_UNCSA|nr:MAG: amidophosphoribosyltransferase [candidate division WOR-1 bacterium RIFOXYA2_FULL_41_14]OGC25208.1 MAG: amidophosphoribosyltransferase [candidate division WOR-1 bacterium RIFOXYB2_FULL_42_35]OGC34764.1 MAG: amidophosphoribosyltransferase [candidate division WOR-1 bacterium RIFOXYC2_FULL_41_25]OGC43751.1 MAG: amidophosphoribosyltransferase [candidate division WOR-1 bacterium RIFOXYD2_FULL_41_8]
MSEIKDHCGVFGIFNFAEDSPAKSIYYGLFALQHRGQESAGIAISDGQQIKLYKAMGLVNQVFNEDILRELSGKIGLGHVRYSTTGSSIVANAQPIVVETPYGTIALAHNGNLINAQELRSELKRKGVKFSGTTDSEVMAQMIAVSKKDNLEAAITDAFKHCRGGYSVVILSKDNLIAVRDPNGIRPLSIGKMETGFVVSSETCALDILGAQFVRDVANGEMVIIDQEGLHSRTWKMGEREALCVFEFIYFARPDSVINGRNLYEARFDMGKYLAKEHPIEADMIIPVPESGIPAAIGYSAESKIPYGEGLIKNRYIGRTFIQPNQEIREMGVRVKLNPIRDAVRGKKVVVIDDSIVRGTTSRQIIRLIREAGAREVHMRISSPPNLNPCFYGIDTATRAELIAANLSIEGIRKYLEADSLGYLSLKSLVRAISLPNKNLCMACLNGDYPVKIPEKLQSLKLLFK